MSLASDREIKERFTERYRQATGDVTREIELDVIGGDWGANGYTTTAQADLLGALVGLRPGVRLLDLGAGRGWPGLYLATSTGCEVVLSDVPIDGLALAMKRVAQEELSGRAIGVACSARSLPFANQAFDAIVHTDVLCCLRSKASVLRSCRRMLRAGGRTAFYTIHTALGLDSAQLRRASRDGPFCVRSRRPYREMLESAGLVEVRETDCTDDFVRVARGWIDHWDARRDELVELLGEQAFIDRQTDRRIQLRATEEGILRRSLITARMPASP